MAEHKPNLDMIAGALHGVQDQIRFADTKASFIAAMNFLLFGLIGSQAQHLSSIIPADRHVAFWLAAGVFGLYVLTTFYSVANMIYAVMPRFNGSSLDSKTHFTHILEKYSNDPHRYCKDVIVMTTADWANDLASQVVEVSKIAAMKHRLIRRASISTVIAFVFWIATLALVTFGG